MKEKIIIVGSGGHSISCYDILRKINKYNVVGYVDIKKNKNFFDLEYIGDDKTFINKNNKNIKVLIGIGQIKNWKTRYELFDKYKKAGFDLPTIFASSSIISDKVKINKGSIIMNNVIINGYSNIGENCIINNNALIEHNCSIGKNTHISTGAIVNGNCKIGKNVFIGSNTTINNGVKIDDFSIIPSHSRIAK